MPEELNWLGRAGGPEACCDLKPHPRNIDYNLFSPHLQRVLCVLLFKMQSVTGTNDGKTKCDPSIQQESIQSQKGRTF